MDEVTPTRGRRGAGVEGTRARRGLWPWFVAGSLLTFAGMSLGFTMYTMLPSGQGVIATPLWRYYVVQVGRAIGGPRTIGPAGGGASAVLQTAMQHILCSLIGGAVMLGIGWAARRFLARRQNAASI